MGPAITHPAIQHSKQIFFKVLTQGIREMSAEGTRKNSNNN